MISPLIMISLPASCLTVQVLPRRVLQNYLPVTPRRRNVLFSFVIRKRWFKEQKPKRQSFRSVRATAPDGFLLCSHRLGCAFQTVGRLSTFVNSPRFGDTHYVTKPQFCVAVLTLYNLEPWLALDTPFTPASLETELPDPTYCSYQHVSLIAEWQTVTSSFGYCIPCKVSKPRGQGLVSIGPASETWASPCLALLMDS